MGSAVVNCLRGTASAPGSWEKIGLGRGCMARVLVVDDDADIREALTHLLESEGHEVTAASDGRVALGSLAREPADVIVLDLMMPVMNGWEFCEAQRMDPVLAEIPVIVISAAAQCPPAAADAFLPKPFDGERLIELVDRHVPHAA